LKEGKIFELILQDVEENKITWSIEGAKDIVGSIKK